MDSPLRDMKYFDAFSGYGGFSLGIQQAYVDAHEQVGEQNLSQDSDGSQGWGFNTLPTCIGYSEIDKYAIQVYQKHFPYEKCEKCRIADERQSETTPLGDSEGRSSEQPDTSSKGLACNCKHKPYGDITKIRPQDLPDFDLLVGGFPCQAFSIAGKRAGFEDTRGTLIYDVLRIVKEKHPRLVLLENVKGLLSHDSGRTFKTIITSLAELGYAVEWQVLNAKNFGVPQNRERVFIIGHLGGFGGRQVFPIGEIASNGSPGDEKGRSCEHSSSIISSYGKSNCHGTYVPEDIRIRRLTPTECERLMGLPDGWTEGVSDTQRYKLCGNGVVVNVVEEIVKRLTNNHKE